MVGMKEYIRDDGEVRICPSNVSKMNILEWMWYRKDLLRQETIEALKQFYEGFVLLCASIINLAIILFSPITFPIAAYINIRREKKEMEKYERYQPKLKAEYTERGI
ncbi:Uncharacterised protein [uncultured archaeon]|nr:Uncharacterised protein [uncultured archaeon]